MIRASARADALGLPLVAAGSAALLTPGTQLCIPEDVQRLRVRSRERSLKRSSQRYWVLVLTLVATAVVAVVLGAAFGAVVNALRIRAV